MKLSQLVNEVNSEQDLYKKVDELCERLYRSHAQDMGTH